MEKENYGKVSREEIRADIERICDSLLKFKEDKNLSYTKLADEIGNKINFWIDEKKMERLVKKKYLDQFVDNFFLFVSCGELFGINLTTWKNIEQTIANDKLKRIRDILDET
ncbi:MAG: hypothetical protein Q4C50_03905 [Eubacteriales bacterium]|nr:hypothetical protein [Eubacteriales bacterium]